MTIKKEQRDELYELAKPIVRWCRGNLNPHCEVRITSTHLEVIEELSGLPYHDFEPENLS